MSYDDVGRGHERFSGTAAARSKTSSSVKSFIKKLSGSRPSSRRLRAKYLIFGLNFGQICSLENGLEKTILGEIEVFDIGEPAGKRTFPCRTA
jgi:hypothetical protein